MSRRRISPHWTAPDGPSAPPCRRSWQTAAWRSARWKSWCEAAWTRRRSAIPPEEFGIVTVEIPELKASEMSKEDIPEGRMADYLLASAACYPAFKRRTIDNKSYVDGGYRDNLPIDLAIELGANEIWAVDLQALGHVPQKLMYDIPVRYIRSYWDLGMFITFSPERIRRNMTSWAIWIPRRPWDSWMGLPTPSGRGRWPECVTASWRNRSRPWRS